MHISAQPSASMTLRPIIIRFYSCDLVFNFVPCFVLDNSAFSHLQLRIREYSVEDNVMADKGGIIEGNSAFDNSFQNNGTIAEEYITW